MQTRVISKFSATYVQPHGCRGPTLSRMRRSAWAYVLLIGMGFAPAAWAADKGDKDNKDDGKLPKTPAGLAPCAAPLSVPGGLPRKVGETIRYVVDVDGLSVGTVDFKVERRGQFAGVPVTEYRSLFKLDGLVSAFLPVEGRAATLVPEPGHAPKVSMSHYRLDTKDIEEKLAYAPDAHSVAISRTKDGEHKNESRSFPVAMQDFISAFYLMRRLPLQHDGCAIIFSNQRAYTVWLKPDGEEEIKTPVGLRMTHRYTLLYASDRSTKAVSGHVWMGQDADKLPFKADADGSHHIEARIHLYVPGAGD